DRRRDVDAGVYLLVLVAPKLGTTRRTKSYDEMCKYSDDLLLAVYVDEQRRGVGIQQIQILPHHCAICFPKRDGPVSLPPYHRDQRVLISQWMTGVAEDQLRAAEFLVKIV